MTKSKLRRLHPVTRIPTRFVRVVVLAVDPCTKGGIAWWDSGEASRGVQTRAVIGEPSVDHPLDIIEEWVRDPKCYLIAVIECPPGKHVPRFMASAKTSAIRWRNYLKTAFARRSNIQFVGASTWQSRVQAYNPVGRKRTLKAGQLDYVERAKELFPHLWKQHKALSADQCAALCILEYTRLEVLFPLLIPKSGDRVKEVCPISAENFSVHPDKLIG